MYILRFYYIIYIEKKYVNFVIDVEIDVANIVRVTASMVLVAYLLRNIFTNCNKSNHPR